MFHATVEQSFQPPESFVLPIDVSGEDGYILQRGEEV